MGEPHCLRYDNDWMCKTSDGDAVLTPMGSTLVPVIYDTFACGKDSSDLASTVNATTTKVFTSASSLQCSYGHAAGTGRGAVVPGYCAKSFPLEWVENIRACGNPIVTDDCLFALNGGNCQGYAVSTRRVVKELVIDLRNAHAKDILERQEDADRMSKQNERFAKGRGAEFDHVGETDSLPLEPSKITLAGHRTGPAGPLREGDYKEVLDQLESRGVDLSKVEEIEIASCGGEGTAGGVGADGIKRPYNSKDLADKLSKMTGKRVKVYLAVGATLPDGTVKQKKSFLGSYYWEEEPTYTANP